MASNFNNYNDPLAPPAEQAPAPLGEEQPQVGGVADTIEDVYKGAAGGLGRGTAGLVGLPGNVAEYGARGLDWATRKVGGALGYDIKPREDQAPTYGSEAAQKNIEKVTGKFYEPHTVPGQYMSTFAEFAPGMAIPGGGGLAARAFNTVVPAVASETAGQFTKGTAFEPWARGIAGITSGPVAAKLLTPAAAATPARQAAVATLEREGIPLSAGDRTGSKTIRLIESNAADMPFSAGRAAEMKGAQATAYDRAVTDRLYDRNQLTARGVPADVNLPDPQVARAGRQSLSDEYNRLSQNQLRSDPAMQNRMTRAQTEYERLVLPNERTPNVEQTRNAIVDRLVAGQGRMAGDEYQSIRSQIEKTAKGAANSQEAIALRELKQSMDEAMARGLSPQDAAAWAQNNRRWANMKQTEGAVAAAGENLSPMRVAQAVGSKRSGQFAQQSGDLDELARAGRIVMKELPNSQTAARLGWQNMLNLKSLLSTGALTSGGAAAGSLLGPLGTVVGAIAPHALSRAALSRPGQAYLGNRALPQNARDVIAQTLLQQAISQPSVVRRNEAEQEDYEKQRPDIFKQR